MNYTPQQLAQALVQSVPMFGAAPAMLPQTTNPLGAMQPQAPQSSGSSMLDPAGLSKMFGGLMGGMGGMGGGINPYAMGGGGYMDAGSLASLASFA